MSTNTVYDHIVIGAGIIGSWTAFHLTRCEPPRSIVLLEQFPLPHSRGSSHGQSRIFRATDANATIVEMANAAKTDWMKLQDQCGETIFQQTGRLTFRSGQNIHWLNRAEEQLKSAQVQHRRFSAQALKQHYPMLCWDNSYETILEYDSGILFADKCLSNIHSELRKKGVVFKERSPVMTINPGNIITVTTTDGTQYHTKSLVIAAGTWSSAMLRDQLNIKLPLHPETIAVCYWRIKDNIKDYNLAHGFPNFSSFDGQRTIYGTPSFEYPGLIKVCLHYGTPISNPELRDTADVGSAVALVSDFIREHFPFVDYKEPAIVERCMYTMTPDKSFIIDTHPEYSNIVYGAGFSGGGFKISPSIGRIMAYLSTNDNNLLGPLRNMKVDDFTAKRFQGKSRL